MNTPYNRIAGQSLERLAALSDGIFAIAMTLLVLELHVPDIAPRQGLDGDWDLLVGLWSIAPHILTYFMSFLTLGIFWVGQQTQLNHFTRSDRDLTWIHIGFLCAVSLMPFSTGFLAEGIEHHVPLIVYWLNIVLLGAMLLWSVRYAWRAGLMKEDVTEVVRSANERRIFIAQSLYAFGALLCIISTYLSIAAIVLVQLNYAFAPRIRSLYKL